MNIHKFCGITLNAEKTTRSLVHFLLLVLAISLSPVACSDSSNPKPKVKPELAPKAIDDKVHFTLGTTKFVIPKKYVGGVGHNYLGVTVTAGLHALLPNFEGYEKHNKDEFDKTLGWGNRLLIRLEWDARPNHYTVETLISNTHPHITNRNYTKKEHGLEVYDDSTSLDALLYIYFNANDKPIVFFRCIIDVPSPGCEGRYDFNKEIIVHFSFHLQYLSKWEIVWKRLDELLKMI